MQTKLNTKSTITETGANKNIEGIEYLKSFEGSLIEVDFIKLGLGLHPRPTEFVESLTVILSNTYLTLDSNSESIKPIRILRESIFDIEEEYDNKLLIYTCDGDYIINKL